MTVDENDLQKLLDHAQEHGDSEGSEAEVGDLSALLKTAFDLLTEDQRVAFFEDSVVLDVLYSQS